MGNKQRLTLVLPKRVDATNAQEVAGELNAAIEAGDAGNGITLDAKDMDYISSAGLRVLLSLKKKYGDVNVADVSRDVYEIFETTGFDQILDVKRRRREVSVEGCEVIGKGYCGTVYRLDPETIIKVYRGEKDEILSSIENEKNMAKAAFVSGIPTAISYDIVQVGDTYGSVFELLNAVTFNDMVIKNPGNLDEIIRQYVDFIKLIHGRDIDDPLIPAAKEKFLRYLDGLREILGEELYDRLKMLVSKIRDSRHAVHGDLQMKNVMMADGEPMLIDMDTLSVGEPIFDLQALFVSYVEYSEDDHQNPVDFLGISFETSQAIWEKTFQLYYKDLSPEERNVAFQKIEVLARIRFMYLIATSGEMEKPLSKLRLSHSTERLKELVWLHDDLNI